MLNRNEYEHIVQSEFLFDKTMGSLVNDTLQTSGPMNNKGWMLWKT